MSQGEETNVAQRFVEELINNRHYDVAEEIIAEDLEFHGPTTSLKGRADFLKFVRALHEAWDVSDMEIHSEKVTSKYVTISGVFKGRHVGEIWGISPTGKAMSLATTLTMRVRGGRITSLDVAYETNALLRQLGVISENA